MRAAIRGEVRRLAANDRFAVDRSAISGVGVLDFALPDALMFSPGGALAVNPASVGVALPHVSVLPLVTGFRDASERHRAPSGRESGEEQVEFSFKPSLVATPGDQAPPGTLREV